MNSLIENIKTVILNWPPILFVKNLAGRITYALFLETIRESEYQRLFAAIFFGAIALSVQNSRWSEYTFLSTWDKGLFDDVVRTRENAIGGPAPPVILSEFGGDARSHYFEAHPPPGLAANHVDLNDMPEITPLPVVQEAMDQALHMQARVVIIDIDLLPAGAQRDGSEKAEFTRYLSAWAKNPAAPFTIFVRAISTDRQSGPDPFPFARTDWDSAVASANNLAWGISSEVAPIDGVARDQS